jgi:hypothetical protein
LDTGIDEMAHVSFKKLDIKLSIGVFYGGANFSIDFGFLIMGNVIAISTYSFAKTVRRT